MSVESVSSQDYICNCIGMIVIDSYGKIACGTTTNGMNHKIPAWVC